MLCPVPSLPTLCGGFPLAFGMDLSCRSPPVLCAVTLPSRLLKKQASLSLETHELVYNVLWFVSGNLRRGKLGCHLACCETNPRFGCPIPAHLNHLVKTDFPEWCLESDLENHKVSHTSVVLRSPERERVCFSTSCAPSWRLQNILSENL